MRAESDIELMRHEWALLKLAYRYASAVDQCDGETIAQCFVEDGLIRSPAGDLRGREEIRTVIPTKLKEYFVRTDHAVHNQLVRIEGATATGETYCVAQHFIKTPEGTLSRLEWGIRYQDSFVLRDGRWYFTIRDHRRLIWSQTTTVDLLPEDKAS